MDNKKKPTVPAPKVLSEEEKKELKKLHDQKLKQKNNSEIIKK